MGYWADTRRLSDMDPSYIESVWWSLKVIYDKGLLVRDLADQPVLPALRDALSDQRWARKASTRRSPTRPSR